MNHTPPIIKVLLVDDEPAIAETIIAYARKEKMEVVCVQNGEEGLATFRQQKFDIVLLDWMLPGISGPEITRAIREKSDVPILMVSARDDESDIVLGLDLGADDYITKPFGPRELMARIKSLLRRNGHAPRLDQSVEFGDITVSFAQREVFKKKKSIKLTPNEFRILEELYTQKGMVVSRDKLMERALGYYDFRSDRTLDTHIKNLRQKLEEDPRHPTLIVTVREAGFKLNA